MNFFLKKLQSLWSVPIIFAVPIIPIFLFNESKMRESPTVSNRMLSKRSALDDTHPFLSEVSVRLEPGKSLVRLPPDQKLVIISPG